MKRILFVVVLCFSTFAADGEVKATGYFSTPHKDGPAEIISSIDKAKTNIRMWMFSMNNRRVIDSLTSAASRGVKVELILNHGMFTKAPEMIKKLQDAGVKVTKGSPFFSITHAKTAMFDNSYVLITTMNLTSAYRLTRDAGVRVDDPEVLRDLNILFDADLANAKNGGGSTPSTKSAALIISPTNALPRLLELIDSAQHEILITVENFSEGPMSERVAAAALRGVKVKMLSPFCNLNDNPFFNFNVMEILAKGAVQVRVPPSPATVDAPYMHQKMMIVDGKRVYIGSENFTYNSLKKAREIGIVVDATPILKEVLRDFDSDWKAAMSLPPRTPATCTVYGKNKVFDY